MSLLRKKKKNKISGVYFNDTQAYKLYLEAIDLRIRAFWRDAGDKYCRCAETYIRMKMLLVAATLYTEAAEQYMKADKAEAILAFQKSIKLYCDVGRFDIAGKLNRTVADIHLQAKHWEDAAESFRKSANFLAGDKLLDQSDLCLEESAKCFVRLKDFREAAKLYEMIARSCINTNLRRFNARDFLLKSLLCLMAIPEAETYIIPTATDSVAGVMGGSLIGSLESSSLLPTSVIGIGTTTGTGNLAAPANGMTRTSSNNPVAGAAPGKSSLRVSHQSPVSNHGSSGARVSIADDASVSSLGNNSVSRAARNTLQHQSTSMYQTKYDRIYNINEQYDKVDSYWRRSKQKQFIRTLLIARSEFNKDEYIDHVYYWHNVYELDELSLRLVKVPFDEIQAEQDRIVKAKADETAARKKAEERAANRLAGVSEKGSETATDKTPSMPAKSLPAASETGDGKSERSIDSASVGRGSIEKSPKKK